MNRKKKYKQINKKNKGRQINQKEKYPREIIKKTLEYQIRLEEPLLRII